MAYKTLRNKALRDCDLITCTLDNKSWYSNRYLATEFNIFKDYKITKNNNVIGNTPNLSMILDRVKDSIYAEVENIEDTPLNDNVFLSVKTDAGIVKTLVNKNYFDLIKTLYPDSTIKIAIESPYRPELEVVKFEVNNRLVAVIMPIKA